MASGGISLHAVDVARGRPADGLRVELFALDGGRRLIAEGRLGANGLLDHPTAQGAGVEAGVHEAVFFIGEYYRAAGEHAPFLGEVPVRFAVYAAAEHYHLPLKFTPWGYSIWRGS